MTETMIHVADLGPADREAWERLYRDYMEFYERDLSHAEYERAWHRFMAADEIHGRGAWIDGELVGLVHFLVHASTSEVDVCYLQDLFTAPAARGRGVARAMIADVVQWARAHACARVYWDTHETNARARRLYDRVATNTGFVIYEISL